MNLFLRAVCIITVILTTHSQKQCFTKKPATSERGPLKMSLTDPIKDFQTGSYSIVNKNPQNSQRFTCFNITFLYINGKNHYEVVASIQNIENYQDKEGLDFSVRFTPNPTVIEGLLIISRTATWTLTSIQYVISARQDFRVGTFVPETAQFLPCGKEASELIINHRLVRPWNATKKLVFGLPFLSGIRTMDSEINVNFNKSTFDAETSLLQIPMSFDDVHFPVEYLLISYLIVTMNSEFQITNIFDLDYIPGDLNVFVGMTGVKTVTTPKSNTSSIPPTPANISANSKALKTGTNTATSTASKNRFREFFQVQGLVIQSTSNLDVLFSTGNYPPNSTIECISAKQCQRYDGFMKYYQNEDGFVFRSECIVCEKFAFFDMGTSQCECRDKYVRVGNACVAKDAVCDKVTQVWSDKLRKCECATGFTQKNGVCVADTICPQGFSLFKGNCYRITRNSDTPATSGSTTTVPNTVIVSSGSSTSSTTTANTIPAQQTTPTSQQCSFPQVWNEVSKSCECPANSNFDDINRKCVTCKQNEIWNQRTKACECISGSFRISGVCDFCSVQGFFNGTGCQCLPGFLGNGKICRSDPKFTNETLGLTTSSTKANDVILSEPTTITNPSSQQDAKPIVLGQIRIN